MKKRDTDRRFVMDTECMATPKSNATVKKVSKTMQRSIGSDKNVGRPKKK
ncbi:MAG: hypothetical protein J6Y78_15385 [Paludibacteraceae bacterium]|nr:hypothetical protein [Paludibacteraceae bacterium]